jgi:ribosomal protein S16
MSVKIVCHRKGRDIIQVVVRTTRNGKIHKTIGTYDAKSKAFRRFDSEYYQLLLKNGAQPSERVKSILKK